MPGIESMIVPSNCFLIAAGATALSVEELLLERVVPEAPLQHVDAAEHEPVGDEIRERTSLARSRSTRRLSG